MEDGFIRRLMTSVKCGACGQRYGIDNINVIGHYEDLWLLSAFCPTCNAQCLVAAVVKEGKAPQLITDLTEVELGRFQDTDEVRADDLLDMHNFLKDFDGDFPRLFRQG